MNPDARRSSKKSQNIHGLRLLLKELTELANQIACNEKLRKENEQSASRRKRK